MVGAADALRQAAGAFGRADIDDEIDIAPVDAKIQRRCADHGLQRARRHGRLDAAALAGIQRTVMQGNRQIILVDAPQVLEYCLGLGAGIDEDQGHFRAPDALVDFGHRMGRAVARPGQALARVENGKLRLRALWRDNQGGGGMRQPGLQFIRRAHRCRQADSPHAGIDCPQPRQAERQQIAALGGDDGVRLIDDHPPQAGKQKRRIGAGQQQGQLFGRGQQDVGRIAALALAFGCRRIAGAGLDADGQAEIGDRAVEVARDIHRQRFQRRNVERVQGAAVGAALQVDQAGQKPRQRFAGPGRGDQQNVLASLGMIEQSQLMAARGPAACGKPGGEYGGKNGHQPCRWDFASTKARPGTSWPRSRRVETSADFSTRNTARFASSAICCAPWA